ncbi:MAG TPA: twin-arginine translocase subunit TatC [Pyrinomonadaceae bacterium]|nr:twin-arginine translocase subunit TatC [Pyrinomonadaceae bacterium]
MNFNRPRQEEQLEAQMSFLEHLDELRRRLMWSILFVFLAFMVCFYFSGSIFNFLAIPVQRELAEAKQKRIGGGETFTGLKEGDTARFIFNEKTNLGSVVIPIGASVEAKITKCEETKLCVLTEEDIFIGEVIVPKGAKVAEIVSGGSNSAGKDEQLIVTTAVESFTLYVTVSLYAAIALSVPFLLWQIWGFISPALYKHERRYVTPFIGLSTVSFVIGAAFAYYILFPPAMSYLLGLGQDFNLMLRATDYFDFITLIMLAMGLIFQMPAITYVLARIGIVSAGFLLKSWKFATVIILIVAAVVSPTGDIPNMMLFAAPMMFLYVVSIFIAWFFGKKRQKEPEI